MPFGIPLNEETRKLKHEMLYGEGVAAPVERLGLGPREPDLWDALPALPLEFGILTPPLPRKMVRDLAKT
jgi:hypothetical protein